MSKKKKKQREPEKFAINSIASCLFHATKMACRSGSDRYVFPVADEEDQYQLVDYPPKAVGTTYWRVDRFGQRWVEQVEHVEQQQAAA